METTKFVRIQSKITILVTPGLQYSDYTDKNKPVPNKLNIKPRWQQASVQIKEGTHYYPAEIKSWDSVKALASKDIITIGEVVTQIPDDKVKETTNIATKFEKGQRELNTDLAKPQKKLADI